MALSPRQFAKRLITAAAVGLIAAGIVASCGGNNAASDPTTTSTPSPSGEVRPGCGTYCQSAGGIQGTLGPGQDAVTIVSSGTVTPDADGYLPVTVTCNLPVQCKGSLLIQAVTEEPPYHYGRSDLLLDAGATATFGVLLSDPLIAYIRAHNPAHVFAIADVGPTFGCDGNAAGPTSGPVLGLPWCGDRTFNGFRAVSLNAHSLIVAVPG